MISWFQNLLVKMVNLQRYTSGKPEVEMQTAFQEIAVEMNAVMSEAKVGPKP